MNCRFAATFSVLWGFWVSNGTAVETVRVDTSAGVPRLLVDGKPVRARMFWGAPGSRPLPIGMPGKQVTFEFTPADEELNRGTMHFRFGQIPGDIYLDDIKVVDTNTGQEVFPTSDFEGGIKSFQQEWTTWPVGSQNTVATFRVAPGQGKDGSAGLNIHLALPPDGHWPDFHIYHHPKLALRKGHRYQVSFWAKAEPARDLTVAFYRPGEKFVFLGGPEGVFEKQIQMAADAGANFVSFPADLPWPKPGEPANWSMVDTQCRQVLETDPRVLLVPRIGMDPPPWWLKAHPDDAMVWDKPSKDQHGAVVASPVYRREAAERLAALVSHLEEKFGSRIAGYHPCGQNTGEWFYQNTWDSPLNGSASADLQAWRSWLRERYGDDQNLRAAWREPQVTFATAMVPSATARHGSPGGVFRDPQTERSLIDWADFQQQAMADCVCQLARAVRQASKGRKLVFFFYGYVFEFGAVRNGPSTSGHYALRRVLSCPDIDVLCSPISYFDRGLGQSAPSMTAAESVALAGKMWLNEDDTRTYLGTGTAPGWQDAVDSLEKTNQELVRNTAQCAVRNFGTWWMDLGATGWFNDPRMWAEMKRLQVVDEAFLSSPRPFRPEVAAVIDEQSMHRVTPNGQQVTLPTVYQVRRALGRMGAPYGQYLLDDVVSGKVSAKVYVFLNTWCLTARQRQQLLAVTRGSLRIWCYAPGYHEPEKMSLEGMKELTGFKLRRVPRVTAWAEPTAMGRKQGLREGFGVGQPLEPTFAAADATPEETLANYPDGSAAAALRRTEDGLSLFVGLPGLTSELLRFAAQSAGAFLFTRSDCNVYANGPYLVLHAAQDGPLVVDTGTTGPVRDALTNQVLGQGPQLVLPLKKGDTRVMVRGKIP